jgi:hypothetical protein
MLIRFVRTVSLERRTVSYIRTTRTYTRTSGKNTNDFNENMYVCHIRVPHMPHGATRGAIRMRYAMQRVGHCRTILTLVRHGA